MLCMNRKNSHETDYLQVKLHHKTVCVMKSDSILTLQYFYYINH